ncbi:hypothetical protein C8R42DRAFT_646415 [Lentinula raphanica]|nr:hypothetical protein C8R42DRAFT_646415 [Lentinula raphanica]
MSHLEAITMTDLPYKYYTTFESVQGAVTSLSISADGKYLAATGVFGAAVWDLNSLTLPGVRARDEEKRLFSTSAWLCFDDGSGDTFRYVLILGCLNGDVTALDLNEEEMELQANRLPIAPSTAQQVVSLDVQQPEVGNRSHARVVASFADSIIKCWTLCFDGDFELVFSMTLEPSFFPKTVCFDKENQRVLVFSKRGGVCVLLDCSTGEVISRIENGCQLIFVQDGMDPEKAFPCQVAFVENGSKIVGGTDQGEALLFDSHSGLLEQRMEFPTKKPVPAITTCTLKDRYYIAVAVAGTSSGTSSGKTSAIAVMCKLRTQTPVYQSRVPLKKKADPVIFAVHKSTVIFLMYVLSGIIVLVVALLWRPAIANFNIVGAYLWEMLHTLHCIVSGTSSENMQQNRYTEQEGLYMNATWVQMGWEETYPPDFAPGLSFDKVRSENSKGISDLKRSTSMKDEQDVDPGPSIIVEWSAGNRNWSNSNPLIHLICLQAQLNLQPLWSLHLYHSQLRFDHYRPRSGDRLIQKQRAGMV